MKNITLPNSRSFNLAKYLINGGVSLKDVLIDNINDYEDYSSWDVCASNYHDGKFPFRSIEKLDFNGKVRFDLVESYGAKLSIQASDGLVTEVTATTCSGHYVTLKSISGKIIAANCDSKFSCNFWDDGEVNPSKRRSLRLTRINSGYNFFNHYHNNSEYHIFDKLGKSILTWPLEDQLRFIWVDRFKVLFFEGFTFKNVMDEIIKEFVHNRESDYSSVTHGTERLLDHTIYVMYRNDKISRILYDELDNHSSEGWIKLYNKCVSTDKKYISLTTQTRKNVTARCLRRRARKAAQA